MTVWLGSTGEEDEYRRWTATHGYRLTLAAHLIADTTSPTRADFEKARRVIEAVCLSS